MRRLTDRIERLEARQPEQERVFLWQAEDGTLSAEIPPDRPVTIIGWADETEVPA